LSAHGIKKISGDFTSRPEKNFVHGENQPADELQIKIRGTIWF
jgi:hypothetical protein